MALTIGSLGKPQFIWDRWAGKSASEILASETKGAELLPVGAVVSLPAKIAPYIIGGAVAGTAAVAYFGGKGQNQAIEQTGQAVSKPTYTFDVGEGGTVNVSEAGGTPTVTQSAEQEAKQSPDYMQWLLIGGVAIAALYLLKGRGK